MPRSTSARGAAAAFAVLVALAAQAQEPERAPFVTTPEEVAAEMLRFAGVGPGDTVADLGSGDGRIVIAAARDFGAQAIGIEIDPRLVALARARARAAGVEGRARFVEGDVLLADFADASVVTVYLLPSLIDRLQPRLLGELAPGTRIVSHAFAMKGWRPDRSHTVRLSQAHRGQGEASTLHLWIVPTDVRGIWQAEVEAGSAGRTGAWRLVVHQNFQAIDVEASRGGAPIPVRGARLEGRTVRWEADGASFEGEARDGRIAGHLIDATGRRPIRFSRLR